MNSITSLLRFIERQLQFYFAIVTDEHSIEFIFRYAVHSKSVKSILRIESFNWSFVIIYEMVKFITSYSVCNVMRQLILAVKIVSLCTRVLGRVIVAVEVHIYVGIFKENSQRLSCRLLTRIRHVVVCKSGTSRDYRSMTRNNSPSVLSVSSFEHSF